QTLVQERRQPVQHVRRQVGRGAAYRLRRLQRAPADEDGEPLEQPLLPRVQQLVAPRDGVAQRPLPRRQVARPARQELQGRRVGRFCGPVRRPPQPCQQRRGGQQLDAGGRQLEGQ